MFLTILAGIGKAIGNAFSALMKAASKRNKSSNDGGGSYGAWTWSNIMNAHCDPEELVDEFGMNEPDSYEDPDLGMCPYEYAYEEFIDRMAPIAEMMGVDVEELAEEYEEEIEEQAYEYAVDYADRLFTGEYFVPDDGMLDWGYYDISDHNG